MHSSARKQDDDTEQVQLATQPTTNPPAVAELLALQRLAGNAAVSEAVEQSTSPVDLLATSSGRSLDADVRADMESRLGADFSNVRIHTDSAAHESAVSLDAHAYTVGSDIVFQRDAYDPNSTAGRTTLAHELTHVVQQRSGPVDGTDNGHGIRVSDPDDRFEREATAIAASVASSAASGVRIRESADEYGREADANAQPYDARTQKGLSFGAPQVQRAKSDIAPEIDPTQMDIETPVDYLTTAYATLREILNGTYDDAIAATTEFTKYTSAPADNGGELPLATMRMILALIPGAEPALEAFEMVEKWVPIVKEVSALVGQQEKVGNAAELGSTELEKTAHTHHEQISLALAHEAEDKRGLTALKKTIPKGTNLLEIIRQERPTPRYDPAMMDRLQLGYELELYKQHCVRTVSVHGIAANSFVDPYTQYFVQGISKDCQKRIRYLFEKLGHEAKVEIATHYATSGHYREFDDPHVVRILLSWNVRIYWGAETPP